MQPKEDFVTFSIAKKLWQKHFPVKADVSSWYVIEKWSDGCHWNMATYEPGTIMDIWNNEVFDVLDDGKLIPRPTIQMTTRWIRDKYNYHIEVVYVWSPINREYRWEVEIINMDNGRNVYRSDEAIKKPEKAYLHGIKYVLTKLV
jgi:hypothetical protein